MNFWHTDKHTQPLIFTLIFFLVLEKCWCVTCCWKPLSSSHHLYLYHSGSTFSCKLIILGITSAAQIQPPYQQNLVSIKLQNTSTACTAFCWLQRKQFHIFSTDMIFFIMLHLYTLKSTFTDFHFTASTCMFTTAGWMVNKRWTCSRIKTLIWLPNSTHRSQTECDILLASFSFLLTAAAFWQKKTKTKQNKQTTKKIRSPASYAVIPVHCIQTRACAVCFAAREVMISSDGTLD